MTNKNSLYIGALTSFILDTKPYHSKLTEIQEIYQFADSMTVHFDERMFSNLTLKGAWPYSYFSGGVAQQSPGFGQTMPLHQLVNPLTRLHSKNNAILDNKGAFKVQRDENTNLPLVPYAYDPTSLNGLGLADAFVQRNGNKAFNEPLLEGHDVFQSKGAFVFQVKQTVSTQPIVVGTFTDVYEVTDGPFPLAITLPFTNADVLQIVGPAVQTSLTTISVTGPGRVTVTGISTDINYAPQITERRNENLLAIATANVQAQALDTANPNSSVNRIKAIMDAIGAMLVLHPKASASAALADVNAILATPLLPSAYDELFAALQEAPATPVIAGYVGWVGQDTTVPFTDKYVDDALTALSPSLYFNHYSDLAMREAGTLAYADLVQNGITISNIVADPIRDNYEEWTLTAVTATSLLIKGSSSGTIGAVDAGSQFVSSQLRLSVSAGTFIIGDIFVLAPKAKVTVHYQAPLEAWSVIKTTPMAYTRPVIGSTRYGYVQSQDLVKNYVTILDTGIPTGTIVLTATSSTTFLLSSTANPSYTGNVTVNTPFNDGVLAFTVIAGSAYGFSVGDKFYIEIVNEAPVANDFGLYYGYDYAPYDAENLVYNNVSSVLANYLEQLDFGYDSRFVGYDADAFNLVMAPNVVDGRQWRLRALPNFTLPLYLQNAGAYETNQVSVIATGDPLNPFAATVFDMPNDITSEGIHSSNDPDTVADMQLWYSTSFALEYLNGSTWVSVDTIAVGAPYTNAVHGLSFTINPAPKPFIASVLESSYYASVGAPSFTSETTQGGDTISWTVKNADPVQIEPASLTSRNAPRLIMHGDGFHKAIPANWELTWASSSMYSVQGYHTAGISNGQPIFVSPLMVDMANGRSYRNDQYGLHFTVVSGIAGLDAPDKISFSTFEKKPTYLVHGSVSGWQKPATVGEYYWNGKIGFKIPPVRVNAFTSSGTLIQGSTSWTTPYGYAVLNYLQPNAPSAIYRAKASIAGHWQLWRDGVPVASDASILSDQYISLSLPPALFGYELIFSVEDGEFVLADGHDLAIVKTSPGRMPTNSDFVLFEKTRKDKLGISIKAKDNQHALDLEVLAPSVIDLRYVDHITGSGVPLANTSPETAVLTGWIPVIETHYDKGLSLAEFSDPATHVVVRAVGTGETVGNVESLSSNPAEPVVFRWDPAFHAKYLPLNAEATLVTYGNGTNDNMFVHMRENVIFLLSGGGLKEDALFVETMNVNFVEDPQWLINMAYADSLTATLVDGPFAGFLPGYDNLRYDYELPDGYYDAGYPLTDHFMQAQSLALLPTLTPQQQALFNDLKLLVNPYLVNGDILATTLADFVTNLGSNETQPPALPGMLPPLYTDPINWTNTENFGIPDLGLGIAIQETPSITAATSIVEAMTIHVNELGYTYDAHGFDVGDMDSYVDMVGVIFSNNMPPMPVTGLPTPGTLYPDFETPLELINGARVVDISFANDLVSTPQVYLWKESEPTPVPVSVVKKIGSRVLRFSVPTVSPMKIVLV